MILGNREVINRLSNYRKVLLTMQSLGFRKVFSDNLADALGLTAAQVRKDLSSFKLSGNKKGGYQVEVLIDRLNVILGKNEEQKIIIIGCGKLGSALMGYNRFIREGIKVVAGFDTDPEIINPDGSISIYGLEHLPDYVVREQVKVAVMTVPESAAQHVFQILLESDIRGVLNFTPAQLKDTENCVVHNVNLALEIENLFYFAKSQESGDQVDPNNE